MCSITFVGDDSSGRRYYAVGCSSACLDSLPWGQEQFDCAVCVCDADLARQYGREIARLVVDANTDWVAIAGRHAEWIHDLVDQASVNQGRQRVVGDGSPMTSWHDDALTFEQMAGVLCHACGNTDQTVAIVVGTDADLRAFITSLCCRLMRVDA